MNLIYISNQSNYYNNFYINLLILSKKFNHYKNKEIIIICPKIYLILQTKIFIDLVLLFYSQSLLV